MPEREYLSPSGIPGFFIIPAVLINSSSSNTVFVDWVELGLFVGELFLRGFFGAAARSWHSRSL